ncbi:hypothetical protein [Paenibacillus xerothermodurans]|uniref:hypothetical protein n=1 Tax=Paenibacillus xerothermodurans TaxID=1977292 RepID=UPI001FB2403C|nr:hypothetical protein [Paenibacillus xerothermodurans]
MKETQSKNLITVNHTHIMMLIKIHTMINIAFKESESVIHIHTHIKIHIKSHTSIKEIDSKIHI